MSGSMLQMLMQHSSEHDSLQREQQLPVASFMQKTMTTTNTTEWLLLQLAGSQLPWRLLKSSTCQSRCSLRLRLALPTQLQG